MENFHDAIYRLLKPVLFRMDPETSHSMTLGIAKKIPSLLRQPKIQMPTRVFGLDFTNPLGLAAGFDKNADYLDVVSRLGFGFIEVGSVTPEAQAGNARPRLMRLVDQEALHNRMGLNNLGVDYLARNLEKRPKGLIVGASFTKNTNTPFEKALGDYLHCCERLIRVSDYLVADISCPNTSDFKANSNLEFLDELCAKLKENGQQTPVLLKLSCDWDFEFLKPLTKSIRRHGIDGVICSNTSQGLSGRPLFPKALHLVKTMSNLLAGEVPIIGVGGISDKKSLQLMREAGAELFQIYTALIYGGPSIASKLLC